MSHTTHPPRFLALCEEVKPRVKEVSAEDVAARIASRSESDTFALIDVREESEFAAGRIKGAKHMGRGVIERDIEAAIPDLDREIILYCGGGFRSALSADSLQKMGYRNVVSLAGGWRAWKAKSLPTE